MKKALSLITACTVCLVSIIAFAVNREYAVIDKLGPVRVLSAPDKGSETGRIQPGTKVEILGKKDVQSGRLIVTWYRIKFNNADGWISQYVTTGKIISEDVATKNVTQTKAPNADQPKLATFSQASKNNFKKWALKTTSVTYLEYPDNSNWQIWVRLQPDKYTTKENLEQIALWLAKAYKLQTGFNDYVVVTIWHYSKNEVVVKGKL